MLYFPRFLQYGKTTKRIKKNGVFFPKKHKIALTNKTINGIIHIVPLCYPKSLAWLTAFGGVTESSVFNSYLIIL
jgi:hypothetical protein